MICRLQFAFHLINFDLILIECRSKPRFVLIAFRVWFKSIDLDCEVGLLILYRSNLPLHQRMIESLKDSR